MAALTSSSAARPRASSGTVRTGSGAAPVAKLVSGAARRHSVMRSCTSAANASASASEHAPPPAACSR